MEKFWMVKGSIGSPVVMFHDEDTARIRAANIAQESGEPAYVLEAKRAFIPRKPEVVQVREELL